MTEYALLRRLRSPGFPVWQCPSLTETDGRCVKCQVAGTFRQAQPDLRLLSSSMITSRAAATPTTHIPQAGKNQAIIGHLPMSQCKRNVRSARNPLSPLGRN